MVTEVDVDLLFVAKVTFSSVFVTLQTRMVCKFRPHGDIVVTGQHTRTAACDL